MLDGNLCKLGILVFGNGDQLRTDGKSETNTELNHLKNFHTEL